MEYIISNLGLTGLVKVKIVKIKFA